MGRRPIAFGTEFGLWSGRPAINKLGTNKIEIESVDHTFQDAEFAEYFVVAFAYTNHKVQRHHHQAFFQHL